MLFRSFLQSLRYVLVGLGVRLEHQMEEVGEVRRQADRLGEEVEHHIEEQIVHPPEEMQPIQDSEVAPEDELEVALPRGWRRGWRVSRPVGVVLGPGEVVPRREQGGVEGSTPPRARRDSMEGSTSPRARSWPAAEQAATMKEIDAFLAAEGLPVRTVGVTEGDGNCWYRALATQVRLAGIPGKPGEHGQLRRAVAEHFRLLPADTRERLEQEVFQGQKRGLANLAWRQQALGIYLDDWGVMAIATTAFLQR